jgi:hypothetical protein
MQQRHPKRLWRTCKTPACRGTDLRIRKRITEILRTAQVLIHHDDAAWLEAGRVPAAGRSGRLGRAVDTVPLLHWTPMRPEILLGDHDTVASVSEILRKVVSWH